MTSSTLAKRDIAPELVRQVLSKSMIVDGLDVVLDLQKSKGAYLYDSLTKRRYLDFFTFVASAPVGANHPKVWDDKAFLEKLLYAAIVNPSNSDIYSVEMAEFVETFRQIAMPKGMKYTFWIAGGALAVENAIKAAFDWKVKKNFRKGYKTEKGHQVLHFKQAFHGRSGYALSLTNTDPAKTDFFPKFDWPRITNPKITFPLNEQNLAEVERLEAQAIAEIKQAFFERKDDIAAIIIEPIQGEGGDNHFRPEFLKALRLLALENDAMLIFDEVQTGVGLTGTMWAAEQLLNNGKPCAVGEATCKTLNQCVADELCLPDMIAFGKKTQVCGFMSTARIDEIPDNVFHVPSRINSTWGGNLVDMLRSKKYLEIIEQEHLLNNAKNIGAFLLSKIQLLAEEFKGFVSNPRGRGLMCAFDLPDKETRNRFVSEATKQGVLMLGCGERSVRFRPPLTLALSEAEEGIALVRNAVKAIL
ncbi:MAG: aspartate aminotransferase family protein [Chloroherpetonaceae bacterium]|nr:aspartate aminotransferase family protein [Chloroherpetonaceae bacterium]